MKEKLTNIILKHCDGDLRIITLSPMIDEIIALYSTPVDWAGLDPNKWGELRKQGDIDMEEI